MPGKNYRCQEEQDCCRNCKFTFYYKDEDDSFYCCLKNSGPRPLCGGQFYKGESFGLNLQYKPERADSTKHYWNRYSARKSMWIEWCKENIVLSIGICDEYKRKEK